MEFTDEELIELGKKYLLKEKFIRYGEKYCENKIKENIKEECECGKMIANRQLIAHRKTNIHLKRMIKNKKQK
jgi:hypothetical protein